MRKKLWIQQDEPSWRGGWEKIEPSSKGSNLVAFPFFGIKYLGSLPPSSAFILSSFQGHRSFPRLQYTRLPCPLKIPDSEIFNVIDDDDEMNVAAIECENGGGSEVTPLRAATSMKEEQEDGAASWSRSRVSPKEFRIGHIPHSSIEQQSSRPNRHSATKYMPRKILVCRRNLLFARSSRSQVSINITSRMMRC